MTENLHQDEDKSKKLSIETRKKTKINVTLYLSINTLDYESENVQCVFVYGWNNEPPRIDFIIRRDDGLYVFGWNSELCYENALHKRIVNYVCMVERYRNLQTRRELYAMMISKFNFDYPGPDDNELFNELLKSFQ